MGPLQADGHTLDPALTPPVCLAPPPIAQNPFLIATKTISADVYVFDYSKHPSKPAPDGKCRPDLVLKGHNTEGYGLAWSPYMAGQLLSGSDDAQICLWDTQVHIKMREEKNGRGAGGKKTGIQGAEMHAPQRGGCRGNKSLKPTLAKPFPPCPLFPHLQSPPLRATQRLTPRCETVLMPPLSSSQANQSKGNAINAKSIYVEHQSVVEDVAWHCHHADIFGSVSDDKQLILWDVRRPAASAVMLSAEAHMAEVNCLAFNPLNPNILATGR
eukprot:366237-Chlamydomonas_euryale.AAC.3